jgi:hypothetical protein
MVFKGSNLRLFDGISIIDFFKNNWPKNIRDWLVGSKVTSVNMLLLKKHFVSHIRLIIVM